MLDSEVIAGNTAPQKLNAFLGVQGNGRRIETRRSGQEVEVLRYRADRSDWSSIRTRIDKILTRALSDALAHFDADPEAYVIKT